MTMSLGCYCWTQSPWRLRHMSQHLWSLSIPDEHNVRYLLCQPRDLKHLWRLIAGETMTSAASWQKTWTSLGAKSGLYGEWSRSSEPKSASSAVPCAGRAFLRRSSHAVAKKNGMSCGVSSNTSFPSGLPRLIATAVPLFPSCPERYDSGHKNDMTVDTRMIWQWTLEWYDSGH
jgi:hypothetical protein